MKSGVYYLYEYNHDQKNRNVGFLKITQNQGTVSVQICARGIAVLHNEKVSFSALYKSEKHFSYFETTTLSCENHALTEKFQLSETAFSNQQPLTSVCGFLMELPNHTLIAATEEEVSFLPSLLTAAQNQKISDNIPDTENSAKSDTVSGTENDLKTATVSGVENSPKPNTVSNTENSLKTDAASDAGIISANSPASTARRISRSELSILPRCQWHLANNSFLMHGYHNYNHLLLIEEDGHTLLGVPGIYDKREAQAAQLFGFPIFSDTHAGPLQSAEEEFQPRSHFGYWCRKL